MFLAVMELILESNEFQINTSNNMYLKGFCLGSLIASNVARMLREHFPEKGIAGAVYCKFCDILIFFLFNFFLINLNEMIVSKLNTIFFLLIIYISIWIIVFDPPSCEISEEIGQVQSNEMTQSMKEELAKLKVDESTEGSMEEHAKNCKVTQSKKEDLEQFGIRNPKLGDAEVVIVVRYNFYVVQIYNIQYETINYDFFISSTHRSFQVQYITLIVLILRRFT